MQVFNAEKSTRLIPKHEMQYFPALRTQRHGKTAKYALYEEVESGHPPIVYERHMFCPQNCF
jgi:hypothetical protein